MTLALLGRCMALAQFGMTMRLGMRPSLRGRERARRLRVVTWTAVQRLRALSMEFVTSTTAPSAATPLSPGTVVVSAVLRRLRLSLLRIRARRAVELARAHAVANERLRVADSLAPALLCDFTRRASRGPSPLFRAVRSVTVAISPATAAPRLSAAILLPAPILALLAAAVR